MIAAGIYALVSYKYPLNQLVRYRQLLYFVLPGGSDSHFEGGAGRLLGSTSLLGAGPLSLTTVGNDATGNEVSIPRSTWMTTLISVTGQLFNSLWVGDFALFFNWIWDRITQAWDLAKVLFDSWMSYLFGATSDGPNQGSTYLHALVGTADKFGLFNFTTLVEICKDKVSGCSEIVEDAEQLKVDALVQVDKVQGFIKTIHNITICSAVVISDIKWMWSNITSFITIAGDAIKAAIKANLGEDGKTSWVGAITDLVQNTEALTEIKNIFSGVFDKMPKAINFAWACLNELWTLVGDLGKFVADVRNITERGKALTQRAEAVANATYQQALQTFKEKVEELKESPLAAVTSFWTLLNGASGKKVPAIMDVSNSQEALSGGTLQEIGDASSEQETQLNRKLQDSSGLNDGLGNLAHRFHDGTLFYISPRVGMLFLDRLNSESEGDVNIDVNITKVGGVCTERTPHLCTSLHWSWYIVSCMAMFSISVHVCFSCSQKNPGTGDSRDIELTGEKSYS